MRSCRQARARILRVRDEELELEVELALEQHLTGCERCAQIAEQQRQLADLLERLDEPAAEQLDLDRQVATISARLDAGSRERPGRRRVAALVAGAVAAAAVVMVLLQLAERAGPGPEPILERPAAGIAHSPSEEAAPLPPLGSEPALAAETDFDQERLRAARRDLRAHLITALAALPPGASRAAAEDFAERFALLSSDYAQDGWPVDGNVRHFLDDREPEVVRGALRYLGVRGEVGPISRVRSRNLSPELRRERVLALLDTGPEGLPTLAKTLHDPELLRWTLWRPEALAEGEVVPLLVSILRSLAEEFPGGALVREVALELPRPGPAAPEALLELAEDEVLGRELALDLLALCEDGAATLEQRLYDPRRPLPDDLALDAVARLRPEGSVAWLKERCRSRYRRHRGRALDCLAALEGPAALEAMIELEREGSVDRTELRSPVSLLLARAPEAAHELARQVVEEASPRQARDLLDWLLLDPPSRQVAPSLATLASSGLLPMARREDAVSAVAACGTVVEAELLTVTFQALGPGDRRLAARCLKTIHSLAGDDAARRALAQADPRATDRVLDLLRRPNTPSASLVPLSRALAPVLAQPIPKLPGMTP